MTAGSKVPVDPQTAALLVVDLQPDFMPGGPLGVAEGNQVVLPVVRLLERLEFGVVVATQDWHPPGHVSFASSHPGTEPFQTIELYGRLQILWPDHCVQGTPGAALHHALPTNRMAVVIRKGTHPDVDSYSAFRNNTDRWGQRPPTGLAGFLRERGMNEVFLCGLARDFCVLWSAEDAVAAGFRTNVIWDLTRPVEPLRDDLIRARFEEVGVTVTYADNLVSSASAAG